ncbi:MAG: hypothetical protein HC769_22240 [Cyanobacteria bacterium CRU_2_1]|nr:hypothetical protein [Cyanobacteria bacterium CRU_2_1]
MPLSLKTSDSTRILATGKAKMWMLLVGVNQYQDEQFPSLEYSAADCQGLAEALTDATRQFPKTELIVHHDFAAHPPTLETVYANVKKITAAAKPQDTILFYFSGHGVVEPTTQQAVLCLSDTRNDALLETALSLDNLLELLEGCSARHQLAWLDACHSGDLMIRGAKGNLMIGIPKGESLPNPSLQTSTHTSTTSAFLNPTVQLVKVLRDRAAQSRGFYAILSCDTGERSWEFPELGHGVFTYYLIQGLRGDAADSNGVIDADRLYSYVCRQTVQYIDQKNQQLRVLNEEKRLRRDFPLHPEYPPQTPKRIVDGVGDLILGLIPEGATVTPPSSSPSDPPPTENIAVTPTLARSPLSFRSSPASATPSSSPAPVSPTAPTRRKSPSPSPMGISPTQVVSPSRQSSSTTERSRRATTRQWIDRVSWGVAMALILGSGYGFLQLISLGSLSFLPFAQKSAYQECNIRVGNPPGQERRSFDAQILLADCAAGGQWKQATVETLTGHPDAVWSIALSPDGNRLADASGSDVEVWDLRTNDRIQTLQGHTGTVFSVAISPDGRTLVTGGADNLVNVWDLRTGKLVYTLKGHTMAIWSVAISPDGRFLATSSADNTIKMWNLQNGRFIRTLEGHSDWVFSVAFSPDGKALASASKDGTIRLWDWRHFKVLQTFIGHNGAVRSVTFEPQGRRIASASWDRTVKLWDIETGKALHTFEGHTDRAVSVAFSPDGKTLASSSIDQTVRLWNLENQTLLGTLYGHTDWVLSVLFSPDGKALFSSGKDVTIAIWSK